MPGVFNNIGSFTNPNIFEYVRNLIHSIQGGRGGKWVEIRCQ